MSGFSPEWLALREAADHRARNLAVREACADYCAGRDTLAIVDLGCGTGSNLRALAPHLAPRQHWRLVDFDAGLLRAARSTLAQWGETAQQSGDDLLIEKRGRSIRAEFRLADLNADLDAILSPMPDLVTAAALFDLCSQAWMHRFVAALAARKVPLHAVLIYNGVETWTPPHFADASLREAFAVHQMIDKGFGPAAGPLASRVLTTALSQAGYIVASGPSDWLLDTTSAGLISELARGQASAATQTGLISDENIAAWREARINARACRIGHTDVFAAPA